MKLTRLALAARLAAALLALALMPPSGCGRSAAPAAQQGVGRAIVREEMRR